MIYYLVVVLGVFACSASQLLLKKSASLEHKSAFFELFNWRVIVAYGIFFSSIVINITAMQNGVNLKDLPILESLGYIFVPILSFLVLNEKITKQIALSMLLIFVGIYIFYQK